MGMVSSVSVDRTDPEFEEALRRGFSKARLQEYLGLLHRLHLIGVGTDGNHVNFQAYLDGVQQKGYLFSEDAPAGLVKKPGDLDEPAYSTKFLREHWFLLRLLACERRLTDQPVGWQPVKK